MITHGNTRKVANFTRESGTVNCLENLEDVERNGKIFAKAVVNIDRSNHIFPSMVPCEGILALKIVAQNGKGGKRTLVNQKMPYDSIPVCVCI